MNVEIRKGKGIEGLVRGHYYTTPYEETSLVHDDKFVPLMKKYERCLDERVWFGTSLDKVFGGDIDEVLRPDEINAFLAMTIKYEEHVKYKANTSIFISKLIQDSYDAGYNDFILDMTWTGSIGSLPRNLVGDGQAIRISIECGSPYHLFLNQLKNVIVLSYENSRLSSEYYYHAEHGFCSFQIKDNTMEIRHDTEIDLDKIPSRIKVVRRAEAK